MPIKVNISLSSGGRFKPVASHTLHERRITIGRDRECTITLEDTQKHVSRMHVEFEEADGSYWLKVVSKVNPVIVNGKRYSYDDRLPLLEGDQITVGLYKLEIAAAEATPVTPAEPPRRAVERPEDITYVARPGAPRPDMPPARSSPPPPGNAQAAAPRVAPPPPAQAAPALQAAAPSAVLPASAEQAEEATYVPSAEFAPPESPAAKAPPPHFLLPETAAADDEVTYIPPMSARPARPFEVTTGPELADEEDFSEDLTSIRRPVAKVPAATPAAPIEPDAQESVPAVPGGVPDLDLDLDLSDAFGEPEGQTAVRLPPKPQLQPQPPPEIEEGFSEDLTYVRKPTPKPAPPKVPQPTTPSYSEADRLAEEETHYGSAVSATAPFAAPGESLAAAASPAADPAVQAFLEGAGLTTLRIPDAEAFMRQSGVMVRAAVEGIMMLLLARQEANMQLGAEPQAAGDNPLKSMADPVEVIAFLFDPDRPPIGDTDPVKAFADACSDLRAHQVALLAGMRAGVLSALRSLDPKKIEKEHGLNLGGLNLTRKSKLWDVSAAQYEKLSRDMEADFNRVFGREILAAYTAQVHKIRGGR